MTYKWECNFKNGGGQGMQVWKIEWPLFEAYWHEKWSITQKVYYYKYFQ